MFMLFCLSKLCFNLCLMNGVTPGMESVGWDEFVMFTPFIQIKCGRAGCPTLRRKGFVIP